MNCPMCDKVMIKMEKPLKPRQLTPDTYWRCSCGYVSEIRAGKV